MKRSLILLLFTLFSVSGIAQTQKLQRYWKKDIQKIKIISYNILDGFGFGKDSDREKRLVEWVVEQDPEIMLLEELCGFNQTKLEKLAKKYGHSYAAIVKEDGYPVGITSKEPLTVKTKLVKGYGHGLLHAETYGLNVLVTHLNPHDNDKRRMEAQNIVAYIRKNNLTRVILAGDMNSHSAFDAEYMERTAIDITAKYGGKDSKNLLNGRIDYSIIATYLSYPLIDAVQRFVKPSNRYSYPTPILLSVPQELDIRRKTNERIDYIFVSPDLSSSLVEAFVWNRGKTEYLSDHFPVGIELLLKKEIQ